MIVKKILYLLFLLCLSFANLFAQRHAVDERVVTEGRFFCYMSRKLA
jgi:hypothetical protein